MAKNNIADEKGNVPTVAAVVTGAEEAPAKAKKHGVFGRK